MAAKIRVKWPDGPICGICFTTALRTRSECPLCGHDGLLPGKDEAGTNICFDCAGIATNMTCDNCGAEAERFRGGHCIRCVLRTDLSNVLNPNSPPDLRLKRLINILAEADRPESVYSWKRRTLAAELLDRIGTRDIALSHDAFDALPASKAVEYLRELLVHHGILTERDRQLATFERWLEHRLDSLAAIPHIHSPIEQFARWHHLSRLRKMSAPGKNLDAAVRSAKQEITETGKFLVWLHDEHQGDIRDCRQAHLDEYLSPGPSTRHTIRTFIVWLVKTGKASKLTVPYRDREHKPLVTQAKRIGLIGTCINATDIAKSSRVAGLILLLYAQPIGKIVRLEVTNLVTRPDDLYLRLGDKHVLIPSQISALFWDYLNDRPNKQTGNKNSQWLFPSTLAGQHIQANTLMIKRRAIGIDLGGARNATLKDLVAELPPTLVARALGYRQRIIHQHAADAAVPTAG